MKNSEKGSPLFNDLKSHAYLLKPNHLIVKPLVAVLILTGQVTLPKNFKHKEGLSPDDEFRYRPSSMPQLYDFWKKHKHLLKDKSQMELIANFDLAKVTKAQANQVRKLYEDDDFMQFGYIHQESLLAANFFLWTLKAIDYSDLAK